MDADFEGMKELAGAVVEQAFADLSGPPGIASEAEHFLRVGLWDTEAPWCGLLQIRRDQIITGLEQRKRVATSKIVAQLEAQRAALASQISGLSQ